jgi:hypothetical protein
VSSASAGIVRKGKPSSERSLFDAAAHVQSWGPRRQQDHQDACYYRKYRQHRRQSGQARPAARPDLVDPLAHPPALRIQTPTLLTVLTQIFREAVGLQHDGPDHRAATGKARDW